MFVKQPLLITIVGIVALVVGVGIGTKAIKPKIEYVVREKIVNVPVEDDLLIRCGFIPESVKTNQDHFSQVSLLTWAPDCRHIAWSFWQSGTSFPMDEGETIPARKKDQREGLYLWDDKSHLIQKVYSPKRLDEEVVFGQWKDSDVIEFEITYSGQRVKRYYELSTGKIRDQL